MAIEDILAKKQAEIDKIQQEMDAIKSLQKVHPDIDIHIDKWGRKSYYAPSVNPKVNNYFLHGRCDCIIASPHLLFKNTRIYSNPIDFYVFEHESRDFVAGWQQKMKEHKIPPWMIDEIKSTIERTENLIKDIVLK